MTRFLTACLILTCVSAFVGTPVEAQNDLTFGVKGGLNTTWVTATDSDPKLAFVGGAFITVPITGRLAIQPELLYARQGGKASQVIDGGLALLDIAFNFDYLQVPVLLRYTFPMSGTTSPYVYFGPTLAVNLGASIDLATQFGQAEPEIKNMKSIDLGIASGGGVSIPVSAVRLSFDVRVTLGMTDFLESAVPFASDDEITFVNLDGTAPDLEHGAVALMVGVSF